MVWNYQMKILNEYYTLDEWFYYWLNNKMKHLTLKTRGDYVSSFSRVSSSIGFRTLKTLCCDDFENVFKDLYEFGYTKMTIKQTKMIIQQCLEEAVNCDVIHANPVPKKILTWETISKSSVLTIEEQKQLLGYLQRNQREEMEIVVCLLSTGLRSAELRAVTINDIDFKKHSLSITKSVTEYYEESKRKIEYTNTKTIKSKRSIPLNKVALKYFKRQVKKNLEVDCQTYSDFGKIIFPYKGKIMTQGDIYYIFSRLCKQMNKDGINIRRITPHMLRHTFATRCFESGMEVKAISEILDHVSVRTTINIYTHPDISALKSEIQKLKQIGAKMAQTSNEINDRSSK